MTVGDRVKTAATVKPPRYASQTGVIAEIRDGEVGVTLRGSVVWFKPSELVTPVTRR